MSVLSSHQNKGIGEKLVSHIFTYSKEKKHSHVSIGIIANNLQLKNWYLKLGFHEKVTKHLEHLPFDVTNMNYKLKVPIHLTQEHTKLNLLFKTQQTTL